MWNAKSLLQDTPRNVYLAESCAFADPPPPSRMETLGNYLRRVNDLTDRARRILNVMHRSGRHL